MTFNRAREIIIPSCVVYRLISSFEAVGGRENSLPRYSFITFDSTLDNCELVLLSSENGSLSVSPTAISSHTHSPLWNPLQARREGRMD